MSADVKVLDRPVSPPVSGGVQGGAVQFQTRSANKEAPVATGGLPELRPAGPDTEHLISQELEDLGVEAKKDSPSLTDEHKGLLDHAKQFTPVPSGPSGKTALPMSEEEVRDKLKTGESDDSGKWLAGLIKKIIAWGSRFR